jgi:hypothetical protein
MNPFVLAIIGITLTVCSSRAADPVPYTFDVQGLTPFEKNPLCDLLSSDLKS